jgi:hypothetical protein
VERVHELFEDMAKVVVPEDADISALDWLRQSGESERVVALAECVYANDFGTSLRHLGVREMQVREREREWAWWAHTGGGNALAVKQPTCPLVLWPVGCVAASHLQSDAAR